MATRRVNVNFSDNVYQALEELAARKGTSMSEVLRDAIAHEKWFMEERDNGSRILIERGGEAREVLFR